MGTADRSSDEDSEQDDELEQESIDRTREMVLKLANARLQLNSSRRQRDALEKRCSLAHQKLDGALQAAL